MTNAEREAEIARKPETDTRPRYRDGTPCLPEDVVQAAGHDGTYRLLWTETRQEVPIRRWTAILAKGGTVPLESLSLIRRMEPRV